MLLTWRWQFSPTSQIITRLLAPLSLLRQLYSFLSFTSFSSFYYLNLLTQVIAFWFCYHALPFRAISGHFFLGFFSPLFSPMFVYSRDQLLALYPAGMLLADRPDIPSELRRKGASSSEMETIHIMIPSSDLTFSMITEGICNHGKCEKPQGTTSHPHSAKMVGRERGGS